MIEIISSVGSGFAAPIGETLPFYCKIAREDGRVFASGGLAFWRGTCWLFFMVDNPPRNILRQALAECESLLKKAAQLGATEVFTPRDANYQQSERLCKLAGFEKTDEVFDGQEVWVKRWQHSEQ